MNLKKINGNKGFTLVELMIVVIIVGILAVAAVPIYRANIRRAYSAEGFATLGSIRSALRLYRAEYGTYVLARLTHPIEDLGLDVGNNHFWRAGAFDITAATATTFTVRARGDITTGAPGQPRLTGITLTMNQAGVTTGP